MVRYSSNQIFYFYVVCYTIFQANNEKEISETLSKVKINEEDEDSGENSSSENSSG